MSCSTRCETCVACTTALAITRALGSMMIQLVDAKDGGREPYVAEPEEIPDLESDIATLTALNKWVPRAAAERQAMPALDHRYETWDFRKVIRCEGVDMQVHHDGTCTLLTAGAHPPLVIAALAHAAAEGLEGHVW